MTRNRTIGWLPGVREADIETWQTLRFGDELELRTARLTPDGLRAQMRRIGAARDAYLAEVPVERIVRVLDRVATRWLDPTSAYRREAEQLLPLVTGYSEPAVRKGL